MELTVPKNLALVLAALLNGQFRLKAMKAHVHERCFGFLFWMKLLHSGFSFRWKEIKFFVDLVKDLYRPKDALPFLFQSTTEPEIDFAAASIAELTWGGTTFNCFPRFSELVLFFS